MMNEEEIIHGEKKIMVNKLGILDWYVTLQCVSTKGHPACHSNIPLKNMV